jgi:hypothetical protein
MMAWYQILALCLCGVFLLTALLNPKVNVWRVVSAQVKSFFASAPAFNALDFVSFVLAPFVFGLFIELGFHFTFDTSVSGTLLTVFSILFSLLLGFATLLVDRKDDGGNALATRVADQTFVSILSAMIFSLLSSVLLIFLSIGSLTDWAGMILSGSVICLGSATILLLLMVIKRLFALFMKEKK